MFEILKKMFLSNQISRIELEKAVEKKWISIEDMNKILDL